MSIRERTWPCAGALALNPPQNIRPPPSIHPSFLPHRPHPSSYLGEVEEVDLEGVEHALARHDDLVGLLRHVQGADQGRHLLGGLPLWVCGWGIGGGLLDTVQWICFVNFKNTRHDTPQHHTSIHTRPAPNPKAKKKTCLGELREALLAGPHRGVDDLEEELAGARIEDEDGAVDGLGRQVAWGC